MPVRGKVTSTSPIFIVSDLQRSIDFYCSKLGFVEPAVWGDPPCFAMINRDEFDLMLKLVEEGAPIHPNGPSGAWDCYIKVSDIAAEAAALRSAGVTLERELCNTEYGMIEVELVDPDGYRICFGQRSS